jgi:hypothetical protein
VPAREECVKRRATQAREMTEMHPTRTWRRRQAHLSRAKGQVLTARMKRQIVARQGLQVGQMAGIKQRGQTKEEEHVLTTCAWMRRMVWSACMSRTTLERQRMKRVVGWMKETRGPRTGRRWGTTPSLPGCKWKRIWDAPLPRRGGSRRLATKQGPLEVDREEEEMPMTLSCRRLSGQRTMKSPTGR